jgi:hypothetical protein
VSQRELLFGNLREGNPAFTYWVMVPPFVVWVAAGDIGFDYSIILGEEIAEKQEWIWETFSNAAYVSMAAALFWYSRFLVSK